MSGLLYDHEVLNRLSKELIHIGDIDGLTGERDAYSEEESFDSLQPSEDLNAADLRTWIDPFAIQKRKGSSHNSTNLKVPESISDKPQPWL